jgi:hypothetical protein
MLAFTSAIKEKIMDFMSYVGQLQYIWMIFFIMIVAGLAKEHQLFAPVYAYVKNTFRSNKFVLVILSAVGGVLPIEGRVTVSAGLLDTIAPKEPASRQKYGIIDYLATHHYYMWSPLEKTVILPIAAFGLTYTAWMGMIWPLLVGSLAFVGWYIWKQISPEEIAIAPSTFKLSAVIRNVMPMIIAIALYIKTEHYILCFGLLALYYMIITQTWNYKKLLSYINWEVIITVGVVIILGTFFKSYDKAFQAYISGLGLDPHGFVSMLIISVLGFVFSFLMGSSGKFVAMAVLMAQLFGMEYFLWFFAIDYSGYLLSPTHKCVMVGNRYFGTPYGIYYKALITWAVILLAISGILTFII